MSLLVLAPATAGAATITVNSTGDTAAEDAACTLREAISAANTNTESGNGSGGDPECAAGSPAPTSDTIEFAIAGAGQHLIAITTAYPAITESASIDATAEPDEVRLDNVGAVVSAFDVEADDVEIRDLTITRFSSTIDLAETDGAEIEGNVIGTDQAGTAGLGGTGGVRLGASGAGGEATNATIAGNVIAAQTSYGIQIANDASSGNVIQANRIGTAPNGTTARPNGFGVNISGGADDTTIGGPNPSNGNVIAGNTLTGISIANNLSADAASGTLIQNNRIGTGIGGEAAVPNDTGVTLSGHVQQSEIRDNLISGNTNEGILLSGNGSASGDPSQNTIAGNLIGTDDDGIEPLGNGDQGVLISGGGPGDALSDNVIGGELGLTAGGACTGDCNVIADNGDALVEAGVSVGADDISSTTILGNHIGADLTGVAALGNFGIGVQLDGGGSGIAVGSPEAPNVIADSGSTGLLMEGTQGAAVKANLIGVGADGTTVMGNDGNGVVLRGGTSGTVIGPDGSGNTITDSGGSGVRIEGTATANAILDNSIYGNSLLAIDIAGGVGVDPNDPLDADGGPNEQQNFPELRAAVAGDGTVVAGFLESEPSTDYVIEVFTNSDPDPSGHGEAETSLGAFSVETDASGVAQFVTTVGGVAGAGESVSATATDFNGAGEAQSTSELGPNVEEGCDVTGTSGDDVALTGTAADEVICALGGDDVIDPGGGDDVVIGGGGSDEVNFSGAAGAVDLHLGTGVATAGADSVGIADVEDATGSDFEDILTGDAQENVLAGGDGDDTLAGGDGDDTLKGKANRDTLKGQDDDDRLKGGDGGDELLGGGGDEDDLQGQGAKDALDGGGGNDDECDGGDNQDETPAPGCEHKTSIP